MSLLSSGCYVINQGAHFLSYQGRARSLDRARADWPEYGWLFEESEAIRRFGTESLGLHENGNYTTFVKLDREYLVAVVSAAKPTSFERKIWRFPVVGAVPYKGFYNPKKARRLAERLQKEGWETLVRKVDAFSSLGYFRDPLYSFMADYHHERLANLILHEMTHATIWIKGDTPLNEAIATFVGNQGALAYLKERYGEDSEIFRQGVLRQAESRRFVSFMRELAARLEILYQAELSEAETLSRKEEIIREAKERFAGSYAEWFESDRYRFLPETEITNAYVDLFRTYNEDVELIRELYDLSGESLRELLARLRDLAEAEEPRSRLRELIASGRV
jgi:predicted aminopeptidase